MIKLLLIDHRQSYRKLEKQLNLYGFDTTVTNQSDQALSMAINAPPDIILMGVHGLKGNSWKIIQSLRSLRQTWSIPVIALAENTVSGDFLLEAGFDTYLRQPILIKHLVWRMNALLATKSTAQTSPQAIDVLVNGLDSTGEDTIAYQSQDSWLGKVVHVEDSAIDSRAMAQVIRKLGFDYINISEPLEVLPKLLEIKPQYIFLDLVLPMVNGYELCGQIRRITAFKEIPITIITGNSGISSRLRARFSGASGFLCKPIREDKVRNILLKNYCYPTQFSLVA